MKKFESVKNIISLFIVIAIIASLLIYYAQTFLYLPFTVPIQGMSFDLFKKPVRIEVMTDLNQFAHMTERSIYFPEDQTQYEKLARKYADFYAKVLSNGSIVPFDSYEVQNLNMTGTRYVINLRCGDQSVLLQMDFMDCNEVVQMRGEYYTITPALRNQLINYIKETYPIKEVIYAN